MTSLFKAWFFYFWLIGATLVLSFLLGNNPEMASFINPSEKFKMWLIDVYGSSNGEELADLELLYVFTCSFLIVLASALGFHWLKGLLIKRSGR